MEMIIDFPGGAKVDAHFDGFTIKTDQPAQGGGENSAPAPFSVFLASIGTCAGIYVLGFCQQRGLPTEGIQIVERIGRGPGGRMAIDLEIQVPPSFPRALQRRPGKHRQPVRGEESPGEPPDLQYLHQSGGNAEVRLRIKRKKPGLLQAFCV